jgi:hypothetical protein
LWAALAARSGAPSGAWWEAVERHALLALADDPGMGLGLGSPADLAGLPAVACGAAKQEVFDGYGPGSELFHAYRGESLSVYEGRPGQGGAAAQDTIETVMVAAARATGRFGNVPRRFLYAARRVDAGFVRAVQALSEQAMQRVLSVKAGAAPLDFRTFEKHVLRPLRQGKAPDHEGMPPALDELLGTETMRRVCDRIRENMDAAAPLWVQWLARPSNLGGLLEQAGGQLEVPLEDPRVRPFLR